MCVGVQENISRERQEWERVKEREQEVIRQERAKLELQRKRLEKQEVSPRARPRWKEKQRLPEPLSCAAWTGAEVNCLPCGA